MNPKEKAKELIEKYQFVCIQNYTSMHEVKRCVLIAIDEICEAIDWHEFDHPNEEWDYWNRVKKEVELFIS
jgi:hypothetical protein